MRTTDNCTRNERKFSIEYSDNSVHRQCGVPLNKVITIFEFLLRNDISANRKERSTFAKNVISKKES